MHRDNADKKGRLIHLTANILIAILIAGLWAVMVCAGSMGSVSYKTGDTSSVAIECILAWDGAYADTILEVLRDTDTRISFVISGETARDNPGLVRRIADAGHSLYTCGMRYTDADTLDEYALVRSITESCGVIESLGVRAGGFYCVSSDTAKAVRASAGANLPCIRCTVDLMCARGDASDLTARAYYAAEGGNIIAVTPTKALCEALPDILNTVRGKGFCVTGV